jgi:photosystem II stability/assembly factor-like uncharacterized protein
LFIVGSACARRGSTDGGVDGGVSGRWTLAATGLPTGTVTALAVDAHDPTTVYAALDPGLVYKTTDGGSTWAPASNGIIVPAVTFSPGIFSLAADRNDPRIVYAGSTWGTVWKTTDGANSWSAFIVGTSTADPGPRSAVVALDPGDSNRIYVGGHYGLFTTTDGGASWNALLQGPPTNVEWIALDPHDQTIAYSCENWTAIKVSDAATVNYIDPMWLSPSCSGAVDASGALYMGPWVSESSTVSSATVLVTRDEGATWSPAASGLADPSEVGTLVFAADPVEPGTVYVIEHLLADAAGAPGRVWRTIDGASWQDISDKLGRHAERNHGCAIRSKHRLRWNDGRPRLQIGRIGARRPSA